MWPEVLRFWQHKVEAKASALHTFRWMAVDESSPFLHLSFTGHFCLYINIYWWKIVALQLHQLNCTRIFDTCSHLFVHWTFILTCSVRLIKAATTIQRIWRGHRLRCQKFQRVTSWAKKSLTAIRRRVIQHDRTPLLSDLYKIRHHVMAGIDVSTIHLVSNILPHPSSMFLSKFKMISKRLQLDTE